MKINEKIIKQIISEEIGEMLSEEEITEILPFLRRRRQRQARTQIPRKSAGTPDRPRRTPVPDPEPEPTTAPSPRGETRKIKTISFTKDIMPELVDEMAPADKQKLGLLYKRLKRKNLIGKEISTGNKTDKSQAVKIIQRSIRAANTKHKAESEARRKQLNSLRRQFNAVKTKEEAEKIIRQAAEDVRFPDEVLRYLTGMLGDDVRIVESVIKRIVLENLKGNKVVL